MEETRHCKNMPQIHRFIKNKMKDKTAMIDLKQEMMVNNLFLCPFMPFMV